MSCGHADCTCDHHAETSEHGHDRELPTVGGEASGERRSGCCGGRGHGHGHGHGHASTPASDVAR